MTTISLISLIVDYEVPPSLIIEAIKDGRLRPLVMDLEVRSLDDIAFSADEARNLFWSYELKFKSAEERTELTRRLSRYEAIVSGLIGAVGAAGVLKLVSEVYESLSGSTSFNPETSGMPPRFHSPLDRAVDIFRIDKASEVAMISLRAPSDRGFRLRAPADGVAQLTAFLPDLRIGVSVDHGLYWNSSFSVQNGRGKPLVESGDDVNLGQPVIEFSNEEGEAVACFGIWSTPNPPDGPPIARFDLVRSALQIPAMRRGRRPS